MSFKVLSAAEVAERLRVDRSTLIRWINGGRIRPAGRLAGTTGAYLFDPDEVERFAVELAEEAEARAAELRQAAAS